MLHMNEFKINEDEKFIDTLGGLIHQFIKTRKG